MTTVHAQTGIKLATKPAKTSLLGGHFIYKANGTTETPSSANVVESVDNDPTLWRHNVHIGSSGIKLRYGEITLSKWDTNSLIFYIPTTTNGITTTTKGLQLSSTGLEIFGSSQSTADLTATSNGINIGKGSIVGADNTVTNYVPNSGFLYLSTKNYNAYLNVAGSGNRTDWRLVVGNNFGITKDGNVYMSGATVSGKIVALTGQIGGTYVGDSWGWTLSTGQLYTGTIGTNNSLHMRSFNLSSDVSINGESRNDWRFTIGDKFGVTKDGYLYANGSYITDITASSLNIGPVVRYGTCTTANAASDKEVNDVTGFSLATGAMITVTFTNGNSSSTPTLNVNSTGAKSIKNYNGDTLQYDDYTLSTYVARTFVYNGTYWLLQDSEAIASSNGSSNAKSYFHTYIADIDSCDGITIKAWNGATSGSYTNKINYLKLNPTVGLEIFNKGISVAQYGETARIGQIATGKSRVEIKDTGIDFYNRTSNQDVTLAHIGYDTGNTSGGSTSTSKFPYYTFGLRDSDSSSTRGNYSLAEGTYTTAKGYCSHAEGRETEANGSCSHAEGESTVAKGVGSHAEGNATVANGYYSHAEGNGSKAGTATTNGQYSHAEGYGATASGHSSHAEGYTTHAEGDYSHAEGQGTYTMGDYSHAEGQSTYAVGDCSHSGGTSSYANGDDSFSHGLGTIANCPQSVVFGVYNKEDTDTGSGTSSNYKYAMIIGNGTGNTASARSNALTVDWNGVARLAGSLFTGCSSDSTGGYEFGRKTGNHIVVGGIHICWGMETITHTGSGASYKEVTITLPYTYTSAPRCFASYANRLTSGAPRTAYATQGGLAGNKIYVASYATAACNAYVNWMTIGV